MQAEFWHERWERGEIGFHQTDINSHLKQFWHRVPTPNDGCVFVPLCGKTRDMLWLLSEGHSVLGVELSETAVSAFFTENDLPHQREVQNNFIRYHSENDVSLLCGDFFALTKDDLQNINAVFDRASLVALPPAMRSDYAAHSAKVLPDEAPILLVTFHYDQNIMAGPPFSVSPQEVSELYREHYNVNEIYQCDLMQGNEAERWRSRGLSTITEHVFLLSPLKESLIKTARPQT